MADETAGETPAPTPVIQRDADGRWLPGSRGGPGRQAVDPELKGTHKLTQLKRKLEIAVRESLNERKIAAIVDKMCEMAAEGNVRAAKLILDKVISNAGGDIEDDAGQGPRKVVFEIQNATFAAVKEIATQGERHAADVRVIDVEVQEVPTESKG